MLNLNPMGKGSEFVYPICFFFQKSPAYISMIVLLRLKSIYNDKSKSIHIMIFFKKIKCSTSGTFLPLFWIQDLCSPILVLTAFLVVPTYLNQHWHCIKYMQSFLAQVATKDMFYILLILELQCH